MKDKIILKGRFMCNIGVTEEERKSKQEIAVDIEMFTNIKKPAKNDDIAFTTNYSKVYDLLNNVASRREYRLIEALAESISNEVIKKFKIKKILVRVEKKFRKGANAAVEITRGSN